MSISPIYLKDAYKISHIHQYPVGTSLIFSNFTPRKSRMPGVDHSVWFGLKYFMQKYLIDEFAEFFCAFECPEYAMVEYSDVMFKLLGDQSVAWHIRDLHELGYLPIAIYALPEGSVVPNGVPAMVMYNTHPDYFWLPGMLETLMSCTLWPMCTSATIARQFRLLLDGFAGLTSDIPEFVDYQAHDFSMRGMFGAEAAIMSGMAHLQYFKGTDTIPAVLAANQYYSRPMEICSVPATEHSVMSAGGKENEYETYERLLDTYPDGILSVVSDTWNLWHVVAEYLPRLKERIMQRDGKLVIRPDSGDPVDILCGFDLYEWRRNGKGGINLVDGKDEDDHPSRKGLIECLWDIFGGTINSKGYKQLDPHIGAIYGDSITIDRARNICERLKQKGFASTNIVFGVGSYTYQYNTRDTLGWAMKSTYAEIHGIGRAITKDPITDDGTKKSHSGILKVVKDGEFATFKVLQDQTWEQFYQADNELKLVYKDGQII